MRQNFHARILSALLAAALLLTSCGTASATSHSEVASQTASVSVSEPDQQEQPAVSAQSDDEIADELSQTAVESDSEELEVIPEEYTPMALAEGGYDVSSRMGKYISASSKIKSSGGSQIDIGNANEGYVRVAQSGCTVRLKVQIIKGDRTYNYDLNTAGNFETFPLQSGNGTYTIRIMKNVSGNKYTQLFSTTVDVTLSSELAPFLYPSQYVNYNANSAVVKKAAELCKGLTGDVEKVSAIYKWIVDNVTYDNQKAATVQTGYLPDPDDTLTTKKGICFDYTALMAAMLRSQGVATKLICGTVSSSDLNHSWNEVYLEGTGWVTLKIYFEGNAWERMDPTFAASGSANIEQYIGDGSNYTGLRVY
jgi:hypothetical protein